MSPSGPHPGGDSCLEQERAAAVPGHLLALSPLWSTGTGHSEQTWAWARVLAAPLTSCVTLRSRPPVPASVYPPPSWGCCEN